MDKVRFLIFIPFLLLIFGCKSKYEKAFDEFEKREFYTTSVKGDESFEEIELLSNAIKFRPKKSALYFYRAEQYELFREFEKAVLDYKTCINQNWIFGNLFYQKGKCELELKNYKAANSDFIISKKLIEEEWRNSSTKNKVSNHWESPTLEYQKMIVELVDKIELTNSLINKG